MSCKGILYNWGYKYGVLPRADINRVIVLTIRIEGERIVLEDSRKDPTEKELTLFTSLYLLVEDGVEILKSDPIRDS